MNDEIFTPRDLDGYAVAVTQPGDHAMQVYEDESREILLFTAGGEMDARGVRLALEAYQMGRQRGHDEGRQSMARDLRNLIGAAREE